MRSSTGPPASSASTTKAVRSATPARSRTGTSSPTSPTSTSLEEHRGRGLGVELVRFSVDEGPLASTKWYLHTADAHDLYRKFGFTEPGKPALERRSR